MASLGARCCGSISSGFSEYSSPENFSIDDMIIARGITKDNVVLRPALVSYLGTPSGRIKKITPPELLHGAEKQSYFLLGKQDILR